jgi:phosphopantothenate---cysteine ligase (CTP)
MYVVTCGPSYEPIDRVRRLTNFSTGELGVLLAESLVRSGHPVICLKGTAATYRHPYNMVRTLTFSTNDDLQALLLRVSREEKVEAVFHTAALCDFKVASAQSPTGQKFDLAKIPSRIDSLTLTLEPARKVIRGLRPLFPNSKIIGWKYELDGNKNEAISRALKQIAENRTDACVINGAAYGSGFGYCTAAGLQRHLPDKPALCQFIVSSLRAL